MTEERFNQPKPNWMSVGWNLLGFGMVGLGGFMVVASEFGRSSDPVRATWFLGGLVAAIIGVTVCLVVFNGWHLLAQTEVTIHPEHIHVRRWYDTVRGRQGVAIPMTSLRAARFFVPAGAAKLTLETDAPITFSIWFWSLVDVRRLADRLKARDIPVSWELPYPAET